MTLYVLNVLILAIGVGAIVGCMSAALWVSRHKDTDLDPETEARIWAKVQAAIEDEK